MGTAMKWKRGFKGKPVLQKNQSACLQADNTMPGNREWSLTVSPNTRAGGTQRNH